MTNFIPCAFINIEEPPLGEKYLGMVVEEHLNYNVTELLLYVFYEVSYKHPEAPKDSILVVIEKRLNSRIRSTHILYPGLYLLLQSQKNIKDNSVYCI